MARIKVMSPALARFLALLGDPKRPEASNLYPGVHLNEASVVFSSY